MHSTTLNVTYFPTDRTGDWHTLTLPILREPIKPMPCVRTVFVSGPYRAPVGSSRPKTRVIRNVDHARKAAIRLWKEGYDVVFCPHLNTAYFDDIIPDQRFRDASLLWLSSGFYTDLYLLKGWEDSEGATAEANMAAHMGMRIRCEEDEEDEV